MLLCAILEAQETRATHGLPFICISSQKTTNRWHSWSLHINLWYERKMRKFVTKVADHNTYIALLLLVFLPWWTSGVKCQCHLSSFKKLSSEFSSAVPEISWVTEYFLKNAHVCRCFVYLGAYYWIHVNIFSSCFKVVSSALSNRSPVSSLLYHCSDNVLSRCFSLLIKSHSASTVNQWSMSLLQLQITMSGKYDKVNNGALVWQQYLGHRWYNKMI